MGMGMGMLNPRWYLSEASAGNCDSDEVNQKALA